jgi:predicted transcriptional regulator
MALQEQQMDEEQAPSESYFRELIEEGIREDDAGEVVTHDEILKMVSAWQRDLKTSRGT